MDYIGRRAEAPLRRHLERGKSVLLLGPRQTGKTTLLDRVPADMRLSLVDPRVRQRYEREPDQLLGEVEALAGRAAAPLVVIDEVQKVPRLLDPIQHAIDRDIARFVLCGSSARKLRRDPDVNLLPGRVVALRLDPFTLEEQVPTTLEEALLDGALPGIRSVPKASDRDADLESYVTTYLEEEIRAEALVRDLGAFARFLELAGLESGNIVSFRSLAQELGISHTTVSGYYSVLEDTLVAERIDPITRSATRKRLTKSSRHLVFDMGVRRHCAREGRRLGRGRMGQLLEQFVGLELVRRCRSEETASRVRFWRDPDGPEVDWVLDIEGRFLPIEVKWTDTPRPRDARHVETFLREYSEADRGFVVCRTPRAVKLGPATDAVPWQELTRVFV